jgi:hypothetical protein
MNKSIEDKIRLTALKQTPPPPTLLKKPESVNEDLMGRGGGGQANFCGVNIPNEWSEAVLRIYDFLIYTMYCRPGPYGIAAGCYPVSIGPPIGFVDPGPGQVTDRDEPYAWKRIHPEFDQADPSTWGSVFGPGGEAERLVRYFVCDMGEEDVYGVPCGDTTAAQINEAVELIRQVYIRRCGFAVSQAGACCSVVGDFGGFACTEVAGTANCQGTFYPGQSCQQIGGDNCGLAPNPLQKNNQAKKQKEVMDMVMSMIKVK